ncbi:MAG: discoidin domain-containing protein, partial [Oscillospiraceae bacterium]
LKNFLKYTRPSPEKLIKDIKSSHPRILVSGNDDFERIKKLSTTDENVKAWYAVVKADADAIIPLEPYAYELPDGLRLLAASRGVKERSLQLAMAYRISGEKKYADRLWAELNNASLYPDWNSKKHFLDSSEMGVAFAIGYDWLYDYWTAEQRTILETAMKNFLLAPAFELYEGRDVSPQNWPVINHNWNVVCNGGITMVAAATMEVDPEYNGKILSYALRSLEYMLGEFAPDGAWPEGVSYWDYAVTFLSFMIGTLDSSFGTDYGYFNIDGIDKTGYYANYMTGAGGVFNFHDSSTGFSDTPELFWFAKKLKDKSLVTLRLEDMKKYNYKPSVQDILWYDKSLVGEKASLPLDIYYRNVETVAVRDTFAHNNGIFASLHAGKNSANHSHMDAGTFVLDAYGERWAEDLGSDDYNLPGYFGPERYNYYRIRTEGHNCFVINPNFYCGQEWSSDTPIVKYDSKPRGAFAVTDVTSAYLKDVTNAKRGMMMDSDRKRLIVQDEVVLPAPSEYWWFMHTKAKIAISDDGRSAVLTKNSKNLILNIIGENSAKFTQMPATPFDTSPQSQAQNKNVGVNKLAIHLSGVDKVNMAVSMVPSVEKVSPLEAYTFVPMNKWNIPDGEIKYANMENIMIDGKPLDGVTKDNFVYEVPVNYDVKSVPSVSVDENFNVVQGRRIGSFSKIIPKGGGENYYVLFKPKPLSMNEISKAKEIPIKGVLASDEPEPENIAINTLDGKSETRWSAEGTQWIQYELEKESEIDFIGIAWWLKNNRKFSFLIETSKDGETWEFAYDGQSAGVSDEKEIYLLKKSMAKFIRITGYGNTENAWNSITEVSIYSANK